MSIRLFTEAVVAKFTISRQVQRHQPAPEWPEVNIVSARLKATNPQRTSE